MWHIATECCAAFWFDSLRQTLDTNWIHKLDWCWKANIFITFGCYCFVVIVFRLGPYGPIGRFSLARTTVWSWTLVCGFYFVFFFSLVVAISYRMHIHIHAKLSDLLKCFDTYVLYYEWTETRCNGGSVIMLIAPLGMLNLTLSHIHTVCSYGRTHAHTR